MQVRRFPSLGWDTKTAYLKMDNCAPRLKHREMKQVPRAPRLEVPVTQEMIDFAIPRSSSHCMIAEGIRAAFPTAANVSVDVQTIRFTDPTKRLRYTYLTPRSCQEVLVRWDGGTKPDPWTFRLRNGHVARSGSATPRLGSKTTQQQRERHAALAKQKLVTRDRHNEQVIPDKVGGRTPPTSPYARRRQFGLRAMER